MRARLARPLIWAATVSCLYALDSPPHWTLTRSEHFEFYSEGERHADQHLLEWFEQVRAAFLNQSVLPAVALPSVRVIVFPSQKEYQPYRVRDFADGSYAHSGNRHYISMYRCADERRIAAHELAHAVVAASGATFPLWLSEGLADWFSTVRVDEAGSEIGGDFPEHRHTLERRPWIPLRELWTLPTDAALQRDRERLEVLYAESWLLSDMLVLAPQYGARLDIFLRSLRSEASAERAFQSSYGKSPDQVQADLQAWFRNRGAVKPVRLAGIANPSAHFDTTELSQSDAEWIIVDMLGAAGDFERAGALLREAARVDPENARIQAALGVNAIAQGNREAAQAAWKRAMQQGLPDADIAYRYALLADEAALPAEEIRAALDRAIALRPDFDDARFKLALLEKSAGRYEAALVQFRAMRSISPSRAFGYWTALAVVFNELGQREDAVEAAGRASQYAGSADERVLAANLAYAAQTDFAVQLSGNTDGRTAMIATRVPHQQAADWNPFVEAGDDVRTARGFLREIDCEGPGTRILFESAGTLLALTIADPTRVRMRHAPEEFVCGPQEDMAAEVQYAASSQDGHRGVIRGIDFGALPALQK